MRKYVNGPFSDTNGKKDFFIQNFIHKRVREWDWAAGIAYFSPLPTARSRSYTLYKYNTNYINFIERKHEKRRGKLHLGTGVEILTKLHT